MKATHIILEIRNVPDNNPVTGDRYSAESGEHYVAEFDCEELMVTVAVAAMSEVHPERTYEIQSGDDDAHLVATFQAGVPSK